MRHSAAQASVRTRTIRDVEHVVVLMQENRSFNHYFGTMRGVRGFGDRITVPLENGNRVWDQSDGTKDVPPYHLDSETKRALLIPSTPHSFSDAQAAWNQGKFGFWPKYKNQYSMGYYRRDDIPFQFALAEAFTICDGYHCSITTGTDPNRIVFWSGSNFNPALRAQGIDCDDDQSEPNNLRATRPRRSTSSTPTTPSFPSCPTRATGRRRTPTSARCRSRPLHPWRSPGSRSLACATREPSPTSCT